MKRLSHSIWTIALVFAINGCTTIDQDLKTEVSVSIEKDEPETIREGIYHIIAPGETLWGIAKMYGVHISDLTRSNQIPNIAQIEKGQLVFIPGAKEVKTVVSQPVSHNDNFIWPVNGQVKQYFWDAAGNTLSKGIDIQSPQGTLVNASRGGKVVFADYLTGYAYTVILDHEDGFHTVYSNNAKLLVRLGDLVEQNMPIAQVGEANQLSFLHFEVRRNTVEDNPLFYLP